jgi:hypothetical protein
MPKVIPAISPEEIITYSDQPFADCVALARAGEPPLPPKDKGYFFSNGREFIAASEDYTP